jgi:hypothetical protein
VGEVIGENTCLQAEVAVIDYFKRLRKIGELFEYRDRPNTSFLFTS